MLSSALSQPVRFDKFETNIFSRVVVTGFRVPSIDSIGVPAVEIPLIRLRYSLSKIIFSHLEIDSVIVSSLRIDLKRDSLGAFNLNFLNNTGKADPSTPPSTPRQISIKYFALQNGECTFNDRIFNLGGALRGFSTVVHLHDLSRVDFTAAAESVEFAYKTESASLGAIRLTGNWDSPVLTLASLNLSSSNLNVTSKGSISFVEPSPLLDAELHVKGSLPELFDFINASGKQSILRGNGHFGIDLRAFGSFDKPDIKVDATADELVWDQVSVKELSLHISVMKPAQDWVLGSYVAATIYTESDAICQSVEFSSLVTLSDSALSLSELKLSTPELTIQGDAQFRASAGDTLVKAALRIKGSISNAADVVADFTSPLVGDIDGMVDLSLNCEGSFYRPNIRLSGDIPLLRCGKVAVTDVELMSEFRDGMVTLTQFNGKCSKGIFSLNGDLKTATLLHHLTLTVSNVDLHSLMSTYSDADVGYEGFFNAHIISSGRLSDPPGCMVLAHVSLDSVEFADTVVPPVVAEFQSGNGSVSLFVTQNDTLIEAFGNLMKDSLDCRFSAHLPEIRHFAVLFNIGDMSGALNAAGSITGEYSDPAIQIAIDGNGCSYWNLPIDSLHGSLSRLDGKFSFEKVYASGATADIDTACPPFGLSGVAGGFTYAGNLNGSITDPEINLTLQLDKFSYRNIPVQSGRLPLFYSNHRIYLKDADLQSDSLRISGSGDYSFDSTSGSVRLTFTVPPTDDATPQSFTGKLDVDLIQHRRQPVLTFTGKSIPIGTLSKIAGRSDIDGRLDIVGAAHLGVEPRIDSLQITIRDLIFSKAHLDSLVLKGRMSDREITISALDGFANGIVFQSKATLSRTPGKMKPGWFNTENRINVVVSGANLDFALVQPFLPDGYVTAGNCELNLTMKGKIGRPKVEGFLKLRDGRLGVKDTESLLDSLRADLSVNDTLLIVEGLSGKFKGIEVSTNAELSFHSTTRFELKTDVSVNGSNALWIEGEVRTDSLRATVSLKEFNLALIQPIIPAIDALGGVANGDIQISGAKRHPVFEGQVSVERLFISPEFLEDTLSDCSLEVEFDNREVVLHKFSGKLGGGTVLASGSYLFVEDSTGPRLSLHLADVSLRKTQKYELAVKQADLSMRQSGQQSLIQGDIILGETHLRSRFTPQKIISLLRTTDRPKQAQSDFVNHIRVDVRVRDSDDIWIDNNLARLKLRADLAFVGDLAKPVVSGRIITIEGYVLYLDRKFNVEHGSLDFYNPHRINPDIDLLAVTIVKGYNSLADSTHTISLSISGELDDAVVMLTSDPPEDLSDIISLLTLGITRRDLTGVDGKEGDVNFQEAVRERLELITSRRVSGYVASNVENYLGLSSFSIENNLFQFDKNWGPQLIASKKISDRAVITYTTTVGRINEQGIKLAYMLTERLAVEGTTDQIGRSGIDLIYKMKLP